MKSRFSPKRKDRELYQIEEVMIGDKYEFSRGRGTCEKCKARLTTTRRGVAICNSCKEELKK